MKKLNISRNFIDDVIVAVSGNLLCKHKQSKRYPLDPIIDGGLWISGHRKVCVDCGKTVKIVTNKHKHT
jgi:hypothetical protein